jgi:cell division transport system ATP-binding protein
MVVSYKNIDISLEDNLILSGINLEVNENDFIFLTGKVGSGKTTLLRTLYGMIPVKGEEACVLDFDLLNLKRKNLPDLRRKLGIIFQSAQLLPDRTVYANLEFVLKATGWKNKTEIDERIQSVLNQVQLVDKADSFPHKLSGGEQQRVAIARAILNNPSLIIADEPTGNLDKETSESIVNILHSISENGAAVIMSTHNLQLLNLPGARVFNCCDQILEEKTTSADSNTPKVE